MQSQVDEEAETLPTDLEGQRLVHGSKEAKEKNEETEEALTIESKVKTYKHSLYANSSDLVLEKQRKLEEGPFFGMVASNNLVPSAFELNMTRFSTAPPSANLLEPDEPNNDYWREFEEKYDEMTKYKIKILNEHLDAWMEKLRDYVMEEMGTGNSFERELHNEFWRAFEEKLVKLREHTIKKQMEHEEAKVKVLKDHFGKAMATRHLVEPDELPNEFNKFWCAYKEKSKELHEDLKTELEEHMRAFMKEMRDLMKNARAGDS